MPYRPNPPIKLRAWRLYRNLSQRQLSEVTGIDTGQLSRFENAKASPYPVSLAKIAAALDAEPYQLYSLPDAMTDVEGVDS